MFLVESNDFLSKQIITYIGNKRKLLPLIKRGLDFVQSRLSKERFSSLDIFSGSGIVSRFLKRYSHTLLVNDLESYSYIVNQCYLANKDELDLNHIYNAYVELQHKLTTQPLQQGIISKYYAPKDDNDIKVGERVFYTVRNAHYLDTIRTYISELPAGIQPFFLAPLISEASIHANTSGVFKGFYKNKAGVGQLGGSGMNALSRIKGDIFLPFPIFSNFHSQVSIFQEDANILAPKLEPVDIAYLDPPYNQHPYGSNYFMLNLLVNYQTPKDISIVSGIPKNWNRSNYNKKELARDTLLKLCKDIKAKYLLISFNSEGFISDNEMKRTLSEIGTVTTLQQEYPVFRASRNLSNRNIHVQEYLYIVEK